jgi:selT/selW/selH-like putative selenoprotein
LAAAISKALGIQSELIQGKGGVFEVVADGKLIFSKKESLRFPEEEEILQMLRR